MKNTFWKRWSIGLGAGALALCASAAAGGTAEAKLLPRPGGQFALHGGVKVIGSTMGYDCGNSKAAEPGGMPPFCLPLVNEFPIPDDAPLLQNVSDSSPDVWWKDGESTLLPFDARTAAKLDLPAGSTIKYARIYWGARVIDLIDTLLQEKEIMLDRPNEAGEPVKADSVKVTEIPPFGQSYFQATADITKYAQEKGAGIFRVTGIDAQPIPQVFSETLYSAWSIVVVYENPTAPFTHIAQYDGLDAVSTKGDASLTTEVGFTAPNTLAHRANAWVVGYEGDFNRDGDSLSFASGTGDAEKLTDASNPADNFFNSSRTAKGAPVGYPGALPELTGEPDTMAGYDLDAVALDGKIQSGEQTGRFTLATTNDEVLLGALVIEAPGCTEETADEVCGPGRKCDFATGNCPDGCPPGLAFDPASGTCKPRCTDDKQCAEGEVCDPELGICVPECNEDADCDAGEQCINGKCFPAGGDALLEGGGPNVSDCSFSGNGEKSIVAAVGALALATALRARRTRRQSRKNRAS